MQRFIKTISLTLLVWRITSPTGYAQSASDSLYEAALKEHAAEIKADVLRHTPLHLKVGDQAPDFTLNGPHGHPVSLSSFKGKYVLVDFWASWCHPCRAENPNVLKAYNIYRDKNFTVLSVSLDGANGTERWMTAVGQDSLPWTQVNEPAGFKQDAGIGKLYDIHFIPQSFLVGPDGKVLFIDLRGEALQQKLASLFSN